MQISIRYEDELHKKLRVIAAYHEQPLNSLIVDTLKNLVQEWEKQRGKIQFANK